MLVSEEKVCRHRGTVCVISTAWMCSECAPVAVVVRVIPGRKGSAPERGECEVGSIGHRARGARGPLWW